MNKIWVEKSDWRRFHSLFSDLKLRKDWGWEWVWECWVNLRYYVIFSGWCLYWSVDIMFLYVLIV